ncbi:MAG: hypothetical protein ABGW81_09045 [Paracoccaceae bacterium]
MATIALGIVGYYQFIKGYPLGPELMERLEEYVWPEHNVEIREMNWGPVAIVQDFQANSTVYDRIVLISAVQRGKPKGSVTCRHWIGGKLDVLAIQDRIFEAVTGIISIENLLVIGEHFEIWPKELIVIEVELPEESVGDLVLRELPHDQETGKTTVVGSNPMADSDKKIVLDIAANANIAVRDGLTGLLEVVPLSVKSLNPLAKVCHNQLIGDIKMSTPIN